MKVVLIGAYGFTGRLIADEVMKANIPFHAAGRSSEKLKALIYDGVDADGFIPTDISNHESAKDIVEEFDVILNCAGPFTEESKHLNELCAVNDNKIYLDITGEVGYVNYSHGTLDKLAKEHNSILIHGCAFESLVVDLASNLLPADFEPTKLNTFYYFEKTKPSPGTKMTMKLSGMRHQMMIRDGVATEIDGQKDQFPISVEGKDEFQAVPYPLPEICFFEWKYNPDEVCSYLLVDRSMAMFVGIKEANPDAIPEELERLREKKKPGPKAEERQKQTCEVFLYAEDAEGRTEVIKMSGNDMYLMTAKCIVVTLQALMTENAFSGVIRPGDVHAGTETKVLEQIGIDTIDYNATLSL